MHRPYILSIHTKSNRPRPRIAGSSSTNAVSFSSARTTKRFPSSRCVSTIQIVRPLESTPERQPQLQPALLTDRQLFPSTAFDCFDFDYGVDPSLPASDNPNAF